MCLCVLLFYYQFISINFYKTNTFFEANFNEKCCETVIEHNIFVYFMVKKNFILKKVENNFNLRFANVNFFSFEKPIK